MSKLFKVSRSKERIIPLLIFYSFMLMSRSFSWQESNFGHKVRSNFITSRRNEHWKSLLECCGLFSCFQSVLIRPPAWLSISSALTSSRFDFQTWKSSFIKGEMGWGGGTLKETVQMRSVSNDQKQNVKKC